MEDKITDFGEAERYRKLYLKEKKMNMIYSGFFLVIGFVVAMILCDIGLLVN